MNSFSASVYFFRIMSRSAGKRALADITAARQNDYNIMSTGIGEKSRMRIHRDAHFAKMAAVQNERRSHQDADLHRAMQKEISQLKSLFEDVDWTPKRPTQEEMDEFMIIRTEQAKQVTRETLLPNPLTDHEANTKVM